MQLQMTAPLDIGLEQSDAILGVGQDDVFDLGETEKRMSEKAQVQWLNDDVLEYVDEDDERDGASNAIESGEDVFPQEEDQDMRHKRLEAELDSLYDAYKQRLWERDAKSKVKEQRSKNKEREEEWAGIQTEHGSDEENTESEGGWDVAQQNKLQTNDISSDESSEDEEGVETASNRKRSSLLKNSAAPPPKRQRLVQNLEPPSVSSSAATRLWFSQGIFSGMDDINNLREDNDYKNEDDMPAEGNDGKDEVCYLCRNFCDHVPET